MKQIIGFLLLVSVLISCSPQEHGNPRLMTLEAENGVLEETRPFEPGSEQIDAVKRDMAELAEGRWTEYSAVWSPESGIFILSVTADPTADETAIKGYCRIMDDIASKHLRDFKVSVAVFFQSGAKIECK
jgi:hypothetical protein